MNIQDTTAVFRCSKCQTGPIEVAGQRAECTSCDRTYLAQPYLDMLGDGQAPSPPTLAQRLMQSDLFVKLYENVSRPFFVRLFGGPNAGVPLPEEEFVIYRKGLGIDGAPGPWLDLSCGAGFITERMAQATDETVIGLDISDAMLQKIALEGHPSNVQLVRADAANLPFADNSIAGVNNAGSIHLYQDREQVFREVFRVLKPGGAYLGSTFATSDRLAGRIATRMTGVIRTDLDKHPEQLAEIGFVDYEESRYGDAFIFQVRKPAA